MINVQTLFKNSNSYRQGNLITSNSSLSPLAKIDDQSRENFLLKYLLLKGKNRYLFEKLNTKKYIEKSDKLHNNIQLSAPRYKGLNCSVVVY